MNKVKLIIPSILFCVMGYVGFTTYEKIAISEAEKFIQANVEALTNDESGGVTLVICRCHSDLNCYGGNAISLRPSCSKSTVAPNPLYGDCRSNDIVCKNLH